MGSKPVSKANTGAFKNLSSHLKIEPYNLNLNLNLKLNQPQNESNNLLKSTGCLVPVYCLCSTLCVI